MIAFAFLLEQPAKDAGIKVPSDIENYDRNEFPHWFVYTKMQLGRPMASADSHWFNAKVVAGVSEDEIRTVTPTMLYERGFA